jgi:hypothetical protein
MSAVTSQIPSLDQGPMHTLLELADKSDISDADRRFALDLFEKTACHAIGFFGQKTPVPALYTGDGWRLYSALLKITNWGSVDGDMHHVKQTTKTLIYTKLATLIRDKEHAGEYQHRIGEHAFRGSITVPLHLRVHTLAMTIGELAKTDDVMKVVHMAITLQDRFLKEHHIREYPGRLKNNYPWPALDPPSDEEQNLAIQKPTSRQVSYTRRATPYAAIEQGHQLLTTLSSLLENETVPKEWNKLPQEVKSRVYECITNLTRNKDIAGLEHNFIGERAFHKQGWDIPHHFRTYAVAIVLQEHISQSSSLTAIELVQSGLDSLELRVKNGEFTSIPQDKTTFTYEFESWETANPLTKIDDVPGVSQELLPT